MRTGVAALVTSSVLAVGCGKKDEATAAKTVEPAAAGGAKAGDPSKGAALPAGFKEQVDADALSKAAGWARKAPVDVEVIEGLRIPGGGQSKTIPIESTIFFVTQYPDAPPRRTLLGFLVLAAENGWSVERFPEGNPTPMFRVRKGDKIYRVAVGAPRDLPSGSALTIIYGPGGRGVRPGVPATVGMSVQVPSALYNNKLYPAKLDRVYGEYGYFTYPKGGGTWAALDDTEPPLEPGPEPTDPDCDLPAGTPVRSPWGSAIRDKLYKGTVETVYHNLVLVKHGEGQGKDKQMWSECADIKK